MRPLPDQVMLFATPEHGCSYLDGRRAVTLFVDPHCAKSPDLYARLASLGFRRSGAHVYRPRCPECHACLPVRVPVEAFHPRRRHRRVLARNADLDVSIAEPGYSDEYFELYRRYLGERHPGGGMDDPDPAQFVEFLTSPWSDTAFVEFRLASRLLAVAVMDRFPEAISAVYTFFEPEVVERSLGSLAILWQIEHARRAGLRWLYLGYLIEECQKMAYKGEYQPQEHLVDGQWVRRGDD